MRYVYLGLLSLFVVVVVIFGIQNAQAVSVSFLGWHARFPLFLIVFGVYLLGMASGGSVAAAVRWTVRGAQKESGKQGSE